MKKYISMLLMIVVYAATSIAQVEEGKWYRIKDVASGTYMSTENYEPHTWEAAGGVKCVEYAESDNQIFTFIPEGTNYKVKSKSGYYIFCQEWNVDALADKYTKLYFEETEGGYFIKNMRYYEISGYFTYFGVSKLDNNAGVLPAGEGYYPFGNVNPQNEAHTSTFVFEHVEIAPLRTITVSSNNDDWGTVSGATTDVDEITITATPNVGYKFVNWTLNGEEVATTSTYVDMTAGDKHYVANFEKLQQIEVGKWYRIKDVATDTYMSAESYNAHPEGSAGGVKSVDYSEVANQIFQIEADDENYKVKCISGYYIYCQSWNVDALKDQYTSLSFVETTGGYLIKNMRDNTYFKVGYVEYQDWMGTPLPAGDGYYLFGDAPEGDLHISTFLFESVEVAPLRTITVSSNNSDWGEVFGATTAEGAITITATPNVGYKFVSWTVNDEVVATTPTFVDYTGGDKHYVANFEIRIVHEVNVSSANIDYGVVEATQTGGVYEDDVVTFTATPSYGYRFVNWTLNGEILSTKNPLSITITEPISLVANFRAIPEKEHIEIGKWYRIKDITTGTYLSAEDYNAHTDGPGGGIKCVDYANSDNQIFTFEHDGENYKVKSKSGYYIYCQKWNVDALEDQYTPLFFVSTADGCYIKNTTTDSYFKVEWIINYYWEPIPLPAGEGYYPFGDCYPDLGMPISTFIIESTDPAPLRTITATVMPDETGIVTINGENNATITAEGDITISATPAEGYRFVNWTLNGEVVTENPTFIDHTEGDKHYIANFEKLPEVLPIELGKWYRIRDLKTGLYLSTENYDPHPVGEGGGVKCVDYAYSDNQIFMFEADGENYKIKSKSGYYIYCQISNVDALDYQYTQLVLEETLGGYYIRDAKDLKYFRVEYLMVHTWDEYPPPAGEGYYPFADANIDDFHTATFVLESVEFAPLRTITVSAMPADAGTVTINGENVTTITAEGDIIIEAIPNEGYKFINWTHNGEEVATSETFVDKTEGNKDYVANFSTLSLLIVNKTTIDEGNLLIATDAPATIIAEGNLYTTEAERLTTEVIVPPLSVGNCTIEVLEGAIIYVDFGENITPVEIPQTVRGIALRNVYADELVVEAPLLEKLTVVSDADNNVAKVSTTSDLSQGVQVVVEKEIYTPRPVEGNGTPTIFNFLSMPFAFNTSDIKYWDGDSWEAAQLETHIRIMVYDFEARANAEYLTNAKGNCWQTITAGQEMEANQGFVIVGNNEYGDTQNKKMELQFTSSEKAYNGSETKVIAKEYVAEKSAKCDENWNFTGVPYLTAGEFTKDYTLYTYDNTRHEWVEDVSVDGLETLTPYNAVMYQAEMEGSSQLEIAINSVSAANLSKAAEDIFARAYISIDDTNPAKIILSDESSENFVLNEDAWYMASMNNSVPAAYFNVGGSEAKVSVQPTANELPMTVYTGSQATHRIALTSTDGNYDVYLKDAATEEVVCLNNEDYIFNATPKTTIANRFTVSMVELTGIIEAAKAEGTIKAVVAGEAIKLYGTAEGDEVIVYNANGMIITNAAAEEGVTTITTSATGVMVIKVAGQTVKVVK